MFRFFGEAKKLITQKKKITLMPIIPLKMPKMGESVAEATITSWLKEIGDTIEADEAVLEIATDKVDSEVPSEYDGVLIEKLFEVDDVVKVGEVVAIIEVEGGEDDSSEEEETEENQIREFSRSTSSPIKLNS